MERAGAAFSGLSEVFWGSHCIASIGSVQEPSGRGRRGRRKASSIGVSNSALKRYPQRWCSVKHAHTDSDPSVVRAGLLKPNLLWELVV